MAKKAIANQTRTRYINGKPVGIVKGSTYSTTSKAYKIFGASCFDLVAASGVELPISTYLDYFMAVYQGGRQMAGNYRDVFSEVAVANDSTAVWAGYRGNHIAEAGRRFERATGVSFEAIAPDLRATASDWVSTIG